MTDMSAPEDENALRALRVYAKRELRKRLQSVRNALPASACAERSARACERICALDEFTSARTIAGYSATRKELSPEAALVRAYEQGKRVVLPRVVDADLTFHVYRPGDALVESGWEILEPEEGAEQVAFESIDLVLVPSLALDLRGFRIGYGKGFYDRVLPRMPQARTLGLVYDFQLLAEVPNEPHDMPLHRIVTDAQSVAAVSG